MASSPQRPSFFRRLAAGAWHVPHALVVFVRTPSLWPLGLPAGLVAGLLAHLGVVAGAFLVPRVEPLVTPAPGSAAPALDIAFTLTLWLGGLGSGALLGFACGLCLVAPLLDLLPGRRDLEETSGALPGRGRRMLQSARGSFTLLAVSALVVPASLAPLTGPFLGALLAAASLGARGMAAALVRRGLGMRARLAWFRAWLPETTGLGLAALVVLLLPGANFVLAPMLWIGGAELVHEIGELTSPRDDGGDEARLLPEAGSDDGVAESNDAAPGSPEATS